MMIDHWQVEPVSGTVDQVSAVETPGLGQMGFCLAALPGSGRIIANNILLRGVGGWSGSDAPASQGVLAPDGAVF
ncbi:hypothetical protein GCM10010971_17210 [Silvimonas amylolytica]|uniref:Uncharacterized protein n=1 Tax=Silvimonas amylolytica TaxID=449663 RepID=A0ABQ2PJX1_9NEIS|nr:hypothetical protein GCM10010971_17210 [Silvimonas amylolytica]